MRGVPETDLSCVFCPGNEHTNPDTYRYPDSADWEIRVIPNKYPALEPTGHPYRHQNFYAACSGDGVHEVIITRRHNEPVALQSIATVELSLKVFAERIRQLSHSADIAHVQVFHNHGRDAGASIIHPHYQLMATPLVPPHIHSEIMGCQDHYRTHGSDVYGDIIKEELQTKNRLVYESDHFVVVSAYASRSPFETWILPKRQSARFEEATEDELKHLSFVLKVTLGQLYTKLNDPPLNFYIHTLPLKGLGRVSYDERAFRWHLTIFPRISIWAGFEYSTGIPINPVPPETTAQFLRDHL